MKLIFSILCTIAVVCVSNSQNNDIIVDAYKSEIFVKTTSPTTISASPVVTQSANSLPIKAMDTSDVNISYKQSTRVVAAYEESQMSSLNNHEVMPNEKIDNGTFITVKSSIPVQAKVSKTQVNDTSNPESQNMD